MLNMTRWTPWTELAGLHRDLDSIFGRVFGEAGSRQPVLSELSYGRFEREFTLPEDIDAHHVEGTYRYGMLELVLPLKEGAKPRRIEVKAAPEAKQLHAV